MTAIAPLEPGGIEALARLFHRLWHETQAPLQDPRIARHRDLGFFRHRVAERAARTIVAGTARRPVGFAIWTGARLNSLFVAMSQRSAGIGSALCAEAERRMAAQGATHFELNCIAGNHRARAFYEARGWRVARLEQLVSETPEGVCSVGAWLMVKP